MLLGFPIPDLLIFVGISLAICITVCTLAMEAAVLFVPAFVFLFPLLVTGFPEVTPNEGIGLAITVEFFGYTSSVLGYWFRKQVDLKLALRVLAITVPLAVIARVASFFVPEQGLLVVFGVVLLALAAIIFRAYRHEVRRTCLLCGDSIAAMRMGDEGNSDSDDNREARTLTSPTGAVDFSEEVPARRQRPDLGHTVRFGALDRMILGLAGLLGGIIGVAIGEISNTFLAIRKKIPVKVATGTAAMVLHVTILAALGANLVILFGDFTFINVEEIEIPWKIAFILAPVVVIGGQIGSMINSKLSDMMLLRIMMIAYTLVGLFVMYQVLK